MEGNWGRWEEEEKYIRWQNVSEQFPYEKRLGKI